MIFSSAGQISKRSTISFAAWRAQASAARICSSPAASVEAGTAYRFQPTATDANGDTLRFKKQGRPGWAAFDSATGTLSGTPNLANVGTYANIVISVTDGKRSNAWVALPAFSITVESSANEAMRAHVLERPHSATVYGLVAAMQSGRFTVEDLIEFLEEGPNVGET